jgi:hypothetical protein
MINNYITKLIENIPIEYKNKDKPLELDIVLDGGSFNGSYLVGGLYFIKEMENLGFIRVKRISGCSVGSIVAFLYLIDRLDFMSEFYNLFYNEFKQKHTLKILKKLKHILGNNIPYDICKELNGKFFVCYNHVKKGKIVKSHFKCIDDIINTIIKSCFMPFLIDGNFLLRNKYIDGINPYIFEKISNRKILYLDLYGFDKITNLLNVKNEKTNFHRILSGMLDIHNFFIKQSSTQMCSFVNDWDTVDKLRNFAKISFERIILLFVRFVITLKYYLPDNYSDYPIYKFVCKMSKEVLIFFLDNYCL